VRAVDVIQKKRNGEELTREEIAFFVDGYTRGASPRRPPLAITVFKE
jgi:pyrimidine-nucleoside phosphorylase